MTEQEMWKAVQDNDISYDGIFFYAVKSTGIYCRPSCKSKLPKRENICFFATAEQAKAAGFRPCKRCRSDLLDYQPIQAIAQDVKQKIEANFASQEQLQESLHAVGVTPRRMTDIFKQEYGVTPKEYADLLRLREEMCIRDRRYTGCDSTSVTYEKAQSFMEAVLYCLGEYRNAGQDYLADGNLSVKQQYQIGMELVQKKAEAVSRIFNEISVDFMSYGVICLQDTIQKGIPAFLKWYDVRYCPQEMCIRDSL